VPKDSSVVLPRGMGVPPAWEVWCCCSRIGAASRWRITVGSIVHRLQAASSAHRGVTQLGAPALESSSSSSSRAPHEGTVADAACRASGRMGLRGHWQAYARQLVRASFACRMLSSWDRCSVGHAGGLCAWCIQGAWCSMSSWDRCIGPCWRAVCLVHAGCMVLHVELWAGAGCYSWGAGAGCPWPHAVTCSCRTLAGPPVKPP